MVRSSTLPLAALFGLLSSLSPAVALSNDQMRPRSIYQLVTDRFALPSGASTNCNVSDRVYCGGTWSAIVDHLDYIQGMGFDTIWISPVVENIGGTTGEGQAYHGYWTLNPENLNSHFGSAQDLTNLADALHQKGMYLMVDVVINHVAATSSSTFETNSAYGPFSSMDDFHPFCWITDYNNQTNVEYCWLGDTTVALPDLNTESQTVIDYWYDWIPKLISNYSIDALRIDTVKHIPPTFWPGFVDASGVYNVGEVLDGDPSYVGPYQNNAKINPLNYPVYYPVVNAFKATNGDMGALVSEIGSIKQDFNDPTLLGVFLNNQDNPRFESYTADDALRMNAEAYALVGDGIPIVYYGAEAGFDGGNDPDNREPFWPSGYNASSPMYKLFQSLNAARTAAGQASSSFYTTQMTVTAATANELLVSKPPLVSVLSNRGSSGATTLTLSSTSTSFPGSSKIVDAVSCDAFTTDSKGNLPITISNGMPRVLIEDAKKGSNVCPGGTQDVNVKSGGKRRFKFNQDRNCKFGMKGDFQTMAVVLGSVVMLINSLC